MEVKVSVIVPVYNVEKYLRKCLDSVLKQTLKEIEIILINDGSTDYSGEICNEYSKKDSRIKVLHKKNEGIATARNSGLEIAIGEFIMFVDSDDWIEENMVETMYLKAKENNLDVVQAQYLRTDNIKSNCSINKFSNNIIEELKREVISGNLYTYVWDKIYKRSFIISDKIKFREKYIFEDWYFFMDVITKCNNYSIINDVVYNYRIRNCSLSRKCSLETVALIIQLHKDKIEYMNKWNMNLNENYYNCSRNILDDLINIINFLFSEDNDYSTDLINQRLYDIRNEKIIENVLDEKLIKKYISYVDEKIYTYLILYYFKRKKFNVIKLLSKFSKLIVSIKRNIKYEYEELSI